MELKTPDRFPSEEEKPIITELGRRIITREEGKDYKREQEDDPNWFRQRE